MAENHNIDQVVLMAQQAATERGWSGQLTQSPLAVFLDPEFASALWGKRALYHQGIILKFLSEFDEVNAARYIQASLIENMV